MNELAADRGARWLIAPARVPKDDPIAARTKYVAAILLFRIVLDGCYIFYMNPVFGTHFLTPMPLAYNPIRHLISYALAIIPALFVPDDKEDFSGIFYLAALMFLYVPMTCMFGFDSTSNYTAVLLSLVAIVVSFLVCKTDLTRARLPVFRNGERYAVIICYGFLAYFLIYSVVTEAVLNINFDLSKIYDLRKLSEETLDSGILAYPNLWTQEAFNPLLLAIGIYRKKRLMVVGALAAQIFFFGITQHRSHLFVPIMIYLALQLYVRRWSIAGFFTWSALLLASVLLLTLAFQLELLPALFIRRTFFVPASVTFQWVEFFSGAPKIHWADRVLSVFIHNQYTGQLMPWYVGYYVSNGMEVAFNDGLIGAGYAHAGLFGVILYAAILGFFVKIVNTMIHSGLPAFLAVAVLFGPTRAAWADSDLLTVLLSHGFLAGIVVMWVYGSQAAHTPATKTGPLTDAVLARRQPNAPVP